MGRQFVFLLHFLFLLGKVEQVLLVLPVKQINFVEIQIHGNDIPGLRLILRLHSGAALLAAQLEIERHQSPVFSLAVTCTCTGGLIRDTGGPLASNVLSTSPPPDP